MRTHRYHPKRAPDDEPLNQGSVFEKLHGHPLTHGHHRGIIWSLQKDHDFFSNVVGLRHWQQRRAAAEEACNAQSPATKAADA